MNFVDIPNSFFFIFSGKHSTISQLNILNKGEFEKYTAHLMVCIKW